MEITTQPVYSASDIKFRGNITIKFSIAVHNLYSGECYGAQLINRTWYIYVRSDRTRAGLIVSGINIDGVHYDIHDTNINKGGSKQSEKILIKDLPATVANEAISSFLLCFKHLKLKSKIIFAKERIGGEDLSPFINGDRMIYVEPHVYPPLHKETIIDGQQCRIWHKSQKNGHRTTDIEVCEAYDADTSVVAFRANTNPLTNLFICTITIDNIKFRSAEHAYQCRKCTHANRTDLADIILADC